jgi:hypothetical protein
MKNLMISLAALVSLGAMATDFTPASDLNTVSELKAEILTIAEFYQGLPDQDFKIQKTLNPYVEKLTEISPQGPVADRIDVLDGRWQQIWGPYEYRKYDRTVDPSLDVTKIYQVVFKDGYYYNVSNTLDKKTGKSKGTSLLRGEFKVGSDNDLNVRFTNLRRIKTKPPVGLSYTDLAELSENDQLEGERNVLPGFIVRLFFGGGTLKEVYTDKDLRIAYGTSKDALAPFLYILKRVP